MKSRTVLVTTLGAEAPVVAITTQLLLAKGVRLTAVELLHTLTGAPEIRDAVNEVHRVFDAHDDWPLLHSVSLPVSDVLSPDELNLFGDALYKLFGSLTGCQIG